MLPSECSEVLRFPLWLMGSTQRPALSARGLFPPALSGGRSSPRPWESPHTCSVTSTPVNTGGGGSQFPRSSASGFCPVTLDALVSPGPHIPLLNSGTRVLLGVLPLHQGLETPSWPQARAILGHTSCISSSRPSQFFVPQSSVWITRVSLMMSG